MTYFEGKSDGIYSPPNYASRAHYLWEQMGGCYCVNGEEFAELAYKLLLDSHSEGWALKIHEDHRLEILAHWMNALDILEHGGSVYHNWRTDKGEAILHDIEALEEVNE